MNKYICHKHPVRITSCAVRLYSFDCEVDTAVGRCRAACRVHLGQIDVAVGLSTERGQIFPQLYISIHSRQSTAQQLNIDKPTSNICNLPTA